MHGIRNKNKRKEREKEGDTCSTQNNRWRWIPVQPKTMACAGVVLNLRERETLSAVAQPKTPVCPLSLRAQPEESDLSKRGRLLSGGRSSKNV
jgi:hypothetical protein